MRPCFYSGFSSLGIQDFCELANSVIVLKIMLKVIAVYMCLLSVSVVERHAVCSCAAESVDDAWQAPVCASDARRTDDQLWRLPESWCGVKSQVQVWISCTVSSTLCCAVISSNTGFIGSLRSPWKSLNFEKKFQALESPGKQTRSLKVLEKSLNLNVPYFEIFAH